MTPGQQFYAPVGLGDLKAKCTYHVIAVDANRGQVTFARFLQESRSVELCALTAERFTSALNQGLLRRRTSADVDRAPPWLLKDGQPVGGPHAIPLGCYSTSPASDEERKRTLKPWDVVDARHDIVLEVLDHRERLLAEHDLEKAIKQFARARRQNAARVFNWVITYLAFAGDKWTLWPALGGRGKYPRTVTPNGKRRGRPQKHGAHAGHDVTPEMKPLMAQGFESHARLSASLKDVYHDVLVKVFKCRSRKAPDGKDDYYQPNGERYPSYGQFRYHLVKILGHEKVWTRLLGAKKYREKFLSPKGSYTENSIDLLEKIAMDVTYSKEYPKSHLENKPLPRLAIAKIRDVLSGLIVGIAFGYSETASLYNQAIAVAALPKSILGRLLGISISDDDWPVALMSLVYGSDRGPGTTRRVRKRLKLEEFNASSTMTPSYSPQSNSVIEAVHTPKPDTDGEPTYRQSHKTPVQMAADIVSSVMGQNGSMTVRRRLTSETASKNISSPIELWKHYESKGRQAGFPMHQDEVIRRFVPTKTYKIERGMLTRNGIIYRSPALRKTKYFMEIFRHEGEELRGYAFDISNRLEWVDVDGKLIEVSPISGVATHSTSEILSSLEQEQFNEALNASSAASTRQKTAVAIKAREDAVERSGIGFAASTVKKGRAKPKTPERKKEVNALPT